jgi:hypothetical protein
VDVVRASCRCTSCAYAPRASSSWSCVPTCSRRAGGAGSGWRQAAAAAGTRTRVLPHLGACVPWAAAGCWGRPAQLPTGQRCGPRALHSCSMRGPSKRAAGSRLCRMLPQAGRSPHKAQKGTPHKAPKGREAGRSGPPPAIHLLDRAARYDDDPVGALDGAQPVRNDQRGAARHHALQRILHHRLQEHGGEEGGGRAEGGGQCR